MKPDRFTQMVEKITVNPELLGGSVMPPDAAALLRRQFAQIRRLVEQMPRFKPGPKGGTMWFRGDGEWISRIDILAALDAYKRRTP